MRFLAICIGAVWLLAGASLYAAEAPSCQTVKFADIGWTDVTATTAIVSRIVQALGYTPKIEVLSVPVTYISLKNRDIDVFLGNWMPTMQADRAPYVADKSIDIVRANLTGARYTLAVPLGTYQAGLHGFSDIAAFKSKLGGRIYGIEPGNDGNRVVLGMIKDNKYSLSGFDLVESSEQGMLAQLDRSIRRGEDMVFLAWEPHPMNVKYQIKYLDDPTDIFGPGNGSAAVFTNTRAGYVAQCPNIGTLLKNLHFTLAGEDRIMSAIVFGGVPAPEAAQDWLVANKATWAPWLDGVTTIDGKPALEAVTSSLGLQTSGGNFLTAHKLPLGAWLSRFVGFLTTHGRGFFDAISFVLGGLIAGITALLLLPPAWLLTMIFVAGAYALHRSIGLCAFILAGLLLIINLGYWQAMIETLALVFSATFMCILVGVPTGIAAAHRPMLYQILRPVLDLMQTIPTFVYLIPTLVLFGLGTVPGLISTVIFAIAAPIRLTYLGISAVPLPLREAGEAFGATKTQLLFKVELPCALPTIMAGITQCIMLSLSMVVIAALVGADGLGKPVVRALNSVNISMGFESGLAIVVLAIILDRVCKWPARR